MYNKIKNRYSMGVIAEKDFIDWIKNLLNISDKENCRLKNGVIPDRNDNKNYSTKEETQPIKDLSDRENKLLNLFNNKIGQVIKANEIANELCVPKDYIYKYIRNIRKKIGKNTIINAVTGGFIYNPDITHENSLHSLEYISNEINVDIKSEKQNNENKINKNLSLINSNSKTILSKDTINILKDIGYENFDKGSINLQLLKTKYQVKNKIIDEILDYIIENNLNFSKEIYVDENRLNKFSLSPNLLSILYSKGFYWIDNLVGIDLKNIANINGMGAKLTEELICFLNNNEINYIQKNNQKILLYKTKMSEKVRSFLYKYNKFYIEDLVNFDLSQKQYRKTISLPVIEELITFFIDNNIPFLQGGNKHYLKDYNISQNTKAILYKLNIYCFEDIDINKLKNMQGIGKTTLYEIVNLYMNLQ